MKGYHLQINARQQEDVAPEYIMKRLNESGGSKYSIHHEKSQRIERPAVVGTNYVPTKAGEEIKRLRAEAVNTPATSAAPTSSTGVIDATDVKQGAIAVGNMRKNFENVQVKSPPVFPRAAPVFPKPAPVSPRAAPVFPKAAEPSLVKKTLPTSPPPVNASPPPVEAPSQAASFRAPTRLQPKPLNKEETSSVSLKVTKSKQQEKEERQMKVFFLDRIISKVLG